jgi:hypothetical protein
MQEEERQETRFFWGGGTRLPVGGDRRVGCSMLRVACTALRPGVRGMRTESPRKNHTNWLVELETGGRGAPGSAGERKHRAREGTLTPAASGLASRPRLFLLEPVMLVWRPLSIGADDADWDDLSADAGSALASSSIASATWRRHASASSLSSKHSRSDSPAARPPFGQLSVKKCCAVGGGVSTPRVQHTNSRMASTEDRGSKVEGYQALPRTDGQRQRAGSSKGCPRWQTSGGGEGSEEQRW